MPPWMWGPWAYPGISPTTKEDDPIKLIRKWKKFLSTENDEKKKEKEKEKKSEPWDQVYQMAMVLFVATLAVGPILYALSRLTNLH